MVVPEIFISLGIRFTIVPAILMPLASRFMNLVGRFILSLVCRLVFPVVFLYRVKKIMNLVARFMLRPGYSCYARIIHD